MLNKNIESTIRTITVNLIISFIIKLSVEINTNVYIICTIVDFYVILCNDIIFILCYMI